MPQFVLRSLGKKILLLDYFVKGCRQIPVVSGGESIARRGIGTVYPTAASREAIGCESIHFLWLNLQRCYRFCLFQSTAVTKGGAKAGRNSAEENLQRKYKAANHRCVKMPHCSKRSIGSSSKWKLYSVCMLLQLQNIWVQQFFSFLHLQV